LGVGVTPSNWASFISVDVNTGGAALTSSQENCYLTTNAYFNSGWKYKFTTVYGVSWYEQFNGQHAWYSAPSGTAGNAISATQAMTLDSSGNLGVGATSIPAGFKLYASGGGMLLDNNTAFRQKDSAGNNTLMFTLSSGNNFELGSGNHTGGMAIVTGNSNITFTTNSAERARIDAVGNVLVGGTAARGTTVGTKHLDLFNGTAPAGTLTNGISLYSDSGDLKFMNAAGTAFDVGYRNIPQNAQSGSYTMVLADAGKHIYHASGDGAATYTIPAASSVAYPLGTAITFVNLSATSVSIAITTDTMYLSSAGTTGTRTLAQYGSATAIKVSGVSSSGIWVISGSGLT
jgi:hypothetical protein